MKDQFALHWIPVHVIQLLRKLPAAPHVEVVKTPLPKMLVLLPGDNKLHGQLTRKRASPLFSQGAGYPLLQNLQDLGGITPLRFTDEQVDMLWHHDKPKEQKMRLGADLMEYSQETIPRPSGSQIWPPPETVERHKVEIALAVVPLQGVARGRKARPAERQNPHPYKPKDAAPSLTPAANKGSYVNDILTRWRMIQESEQFSVPPAVTL